LNKARLDEFNLYWNSQSRKGLYSPYALSFDSYLEGMLRAFALSELSFEEIESLVGDLSEYLNQITWH
jgi:hypothetical protein